jgi:uncharacterized protein (TIGR02391 family)
MNLETEISRELWQAIRRSYESQAWSNAILDSVHYLSDAIRTKTGLQSDGTALAGQAFGGKTPKLLLNKLQTESEKSFQSGVEQLLRGIYQAIRNPRSHERISDSQIDADSIIIFINFLLKLIGHARAIFSIDECVARILDTNFVGNKRYAELILSEIPVRYRLQVAITVFQQKSTTDAEKLRYLFDAIIPTLHPAESKELFAALSTELRESNDNAELNNLLQLLNPEYWLQLDEVARLRTESRLIQNLREGRYNAKTKKCLSGALTTWSRDFWQHFSLKSEIMSTVARMLSSDNVQAQDYVFEYIFAYLSLVADEPSWELKYAMRNGLNAGDVRFRDAIVYAPPPWEQEAWGKIIQDAMKTFQSSQDGPPQDDDIPF